MAPHADPLVRAANLIHATSEFYLDLRAGRLTPDALDTKGKIPAVHVSIHATL